MILKLRSPYLLSKENIYQALLYALFGHLFFCLAWAQQDVSTRQFTLKAIHVDGLVNVAPQKVVEISQLRIGQVVKIETLNEATRRLLQNGSFTKVSYKYKYRGDDLEVTFVVEEGSKSMPCYFDNFVWFSDEELFAGIRRDLPSFDGKATEGGEMVETIRAALEKLLREKNLPGRVETEMMNMGSAHLFKVTDVRLPICAVRFEGIAAFKENQLVEVAKELISTDYSRITNRLILRDTVVPFYRQHGYLKIKLLPTQGQFEPAAGKCHNGVILQQPLAEGISYKWKGITWSGNQAITTERLNKLFALNTGDVADGLKIDRGFALALGQLHDKGFFAAQMKPEPQFDETAQTVAYTVAIEEGPKYFFGQLAVTGLSETVIQKFKDRWQMLQGKEYDGTFFKDYLKRAISENSAHISLTKQPSVDTKPNHENRVVDVKIEFQ